VTTSSNTTTRPAVDESLHSVLLVHDRPRRPNALTASLALSWRASLKMKNNAAVHLIDLLMFPVIFLLIFNYLFGGAFAGSVENYLKYFFPGVLVMAAVMLTIATGCAVSSDIAQGVFERFRTMPFWQPAALVGTMIADIGRYLVALLLTVVLGLVLGFRPDAGAGGIILAILLILVFAFSFSWIFTMLSLFVKQSESMQSTSILLMALVFCSNIFVSTTTMPKWMQVIVDINPISHAATAARGLMHGTATAGQISLVLLSSAVLVAVFAPPTMYLYYKKSR
jgi:ABC-2 type transport system permease protein